ncbi:MULTISPECIES: CAP domain-containing protein [Bacillus]|uniref:CAP domain-containing protein n=2 Tax=Bacillus infantis TaxID=324767 RepID=A0A5D4SLM8_9BACI|nr:hypothetical protein CYJ37_16365 [Bacillus sp. UMB0728]TYS63032.1 hypothetical protein FZD47_15330 [Bacillus infantis]
MVISFYFNISSDPKDELLISDEETKPQKDDSLSEQNMIDESSLKLPGEGLSSLIGKNASDLQVLLGDPERKDPSEYGYEWWIYKKGTSQYVQAGVLDGRIVTLFATGPDADVSPFHIGQPVSEIYSSVFIDTNINFQYKGSSYRFELSEDDLNTRPLIKAGNIYAQLYIDRFTGELSSIRYMDAPTLVKLRPYELVYRGDLIEAEPSEQAEKRLIEEGNEKQIFDISNFIRARHELNVLEWDEATAKVAYEHSRDMFESKQFSHTSEKYGELSDRLEAGEVFYQMAGENIAAHYVDAPAVVEGWLNSKGHRESLLNPDFTHLGVGVYDRHYTQNFIQKWQE